MDALQHHLENKADDSFQVYHQERVELLDPKDSAALQTERDNLTDSGEIEIHHLFFDGSAQSVSNLGHAR